MGKKFYCFSYCRVSILRILDDLASYEARNEQWIVFECEKLQLFKMPVVCQISEDEILVAGDFVSSRHRSQNRQKLFNVNTKLVTKTNRDFRVTHFNGLNLATQMRENQVIAFCQQQSSCTLKDIYFVRYVKARVGEYPDPNTYPPYTS